MSNRVMARAAARIGALAVLSTAILTAGTSPAVAATPDNDDVTTATPVTSVPYATTQDTREATSAAFAGCGSAATVWWAFTPPATGWYDLSVAGSDYQAFITVFAGTSDQLFMIGCSANGLGLPTLRTHLDAGTTYYVEVGMCCQTEPGEVGPGGQLQFSIADAPAMHVDHTLTSTVLDATRGRVTISGTATCNQTGVAYVQGELRQRQGRIIVGGQFAMGTLLSCTAGTPVTWSVQADGGGRAFLPGPASLTLLVSGCDQFGFLLCDNGTPQTYDVKLVTAKK